MIHQANKNLIILINSKVNVFVNQKKNLFSEFANDNKKNVVIVDNNL